MSEFTARHSISREANVKEVMEQGEKHNKAIEMRNSFEKQGFIFEISPYFAMVRKDGNVIIDYDANVKTALLHQKKEELYSKHLIMAVEAVKKSLSLELCLG